MILYMMLYFLLINLVGFFAMMIDKRRAVRRAWRIPEKTLFTIAIIFGSFGVSLGMKQFRHKTKHKSFAVGIPVIEVIQVILVIIGLYFYYG